MSLSNDVDLELLNNCFELGPFHGLHKPHEDDILKPPTPPPGKEYNVYVSEVGCEINT